MVAALLCALTATAQAPLTEDGYVEQVLAHGLAARVAEADAALARAQAVGVGAWPNPSLEWERQPNPTSDAVVGGQHTLTASVPLVLSGRLGLEADAAARGADAADARLTRARAALRREAHATFAAVRAAAQRTAALDRSVAALTALTTIAQVREKAGEGAGYDRTRIALERAVVEDELRAARLDEERRRAAALRLLGPGLSALPSLALELEAAPPLPDLAALLSALEGRRADVAALGAEADAADASRRAAGRSWVPEPRLSAGAFLLEGAAPGQAVGVVAGVAVPLPLFEHGQGPAARADARRALVEAQRAQLLHAARGELLAAHQALVRLTERLARHHAEVSEPAERLRGMAAAAYRGGSADLLVLTDAARVAREAALREAGLALDVELARIDLLFIAGVYDAERGAAAP